MLEVVPARVELRDAQPPGRDRVHHSVALVAEAPLDLLRHRHLAVEGGRHVDPEVPALARLELDPVAHSRAVRLPRGREDDLRPRHVSVSAVLQQQLPVVAVVVDRDERRQRLRAQRVAEREVVLLDREDVGEVGAELERELERDRLERLVLDGDVVLHPDADEAVARDRELVLLESVRERVAHVEGGREVLDLVGREDERALAVDGQQQQREEARVLGKQAAGLEVDVSALVADAEGRAFEDPNLMPSGTALDPRCGRLGQGHHDELVDVHVRRPREREENALGDVVGRERIDAARRPAANAPRRRETAPWRSSSRRGPDRWS